MSKWMPQMCMGGLIEPHLICCVTKTIFFLYNRSIEQLVYLKKDLNHLDSLRNATLFLQWRCQMAELRWNPKACVCFQRKEFGTIIVIGKELIQFDALFRPIFRKEVATFYQGMQEAMLLIGAAVTNIIEDEIDSTEVIKTNIVNEIVKPQTSGEEVNEILQEETE